MIDEVDRRMEPDRKAKRALLASERPAVKAAHVERQKAQRAAVHAKRGNQIARRTILFDRSTAALKAETGWRKPGKKRLKAARLGL
jgi:hypothetical protein